MFFIENDKDSTFVAENLQVEAKVDSDIKVELKFVASVATSAQRVGFFSIGLGRVGYWTKYRVAGREGVSKNRIGCFRVSFSLSGISGYDGYFWVFLGLPIYTRVIF